MKPSERAALEEARAACLASAEAIAAVLAGAEVSASPARDAFCRSRSRPRPGAFRTTARPKAERLMKSHPGLAMKRGGTRWYVHREALR